jgi:hypothetical protein
MCTTGRSPYEGKMWARRLPTIWNDKNTAEAVFIGEVTECSVVLYISFHHVLPAFHLVLWNGRPVWVKADEVVLRGAADA